MQHWLRRVRGTLQGRRPGLILRVGYQTVNDLGLQHDNNPCHQIVAGKQTPENGGAHGIGEDWRQLAMASLLRGAGPRVLEVRRCS